MKVLSNTTSVDKNTLVRLISTKSRSLEAAANMGGLTGQITYGIDLVTSTINAGLFDTKEQNFLHTRVCGSVADSLNELWSGLADIRPKLNDYKSVPLYNSMKLTHMSTITLWAFVIVILTFAAFLLIVTIVFTVICPINIPENNELAMLYTTTHEDLNKRINQYISNDCSMQYKAAFANTLYCRDEILYSHDGKLAGHRIRIGSDKLGDKPKYNFNYL